MGFISDSEPKGFGAFAVVNESYFACLKQVCMLLK